MTAEDVRVHPTRVDTVADLAADVVALLSEQLTAGHRPRIVLTGGSVARDIHRELAARSRGVDWARVTVLWGDERFVPDEDDERNDHQADEDLLSHVPVAQSQVLRVPSSDEVGDVEAAATAYAGTVTRLLADDAPEAPAFDLVMLGIGDDGHVASLFPGRARTTDPVVAVTDAPKPPPERVSMGYDLLGRARRVWFAAVGEDKAEAVAGSVRRQPEDLPAARVRGTQETRWYVDVDAASGLSG
jgi:6-phosphogluconolactonase